MPLEPPGSTSGFPSRSTGTRGLEQLFRICWYRGDDGTVLRPWRYGSVPPGDGRFDLPAPQGTCYWSDRKYGAWVEVFRGTRLIDPVDARRRRLWTGTPPRLRLANLVAKTAYSFGITAEISTIASYLLPQHWAAALSTSYQGVLASCRHDPSSQASSIAVFGKAGTPARQPGWQARSRSLETDLTLLYELSELGVFVAPIPFDVPTR